MATNDYAGTRLRHLKGSDYEVADGQPDIRGWDVKDSNGKTIGEVDDLIFDEQSLKVRYMVVDLDDNDFDLDDDKDVLIPIGYGELHDKGDDVILPNVTATQLASLPDYDHDRGITSDDEYKIRNVFAGAGALGAASAGVVNDEFYNHDYYNQENLYRRRNAMYSNTPNTADTTSTTNTDIADSTPVTNAASTTDTYSTNITGDEQNTTIPVIEENVQIGKQQVRTGGAYIRSRVVEKPIEETVNLREEHINIDRKPVDRPASSTDFDTFKEGVIELEERAEVPVVNKEARVVEEITVNKEVAERTETVRDTVRKTEVDIENLDDTSNNSNYRTKDTRDI